MVGGLEGLISCTVLVHLSCELELGIWVSARWSARCHSSERGCNLAIKSLVKLNHNGFWVGVPRVIDKVVELVKVVINCLLALEIGCHFQHVDSRSFSVEWGEVLSELLLEVEPVNEVEGATL